MKRKIIVLDDRLNFMLEKLCDAAMVFPRKLALSEKINISAWAHNLLNSRIEEEIPEPQENKPEGTAQPE
jgi:hypothetical protein